MGELCERCAPPQTTCENSRTQETLQVNPAQLKESFEKEFKKTNAGTLAGTNIAGKQENEEGIGFKVHGTFQANREGKSMGKLANEQPDANIINLTNLLYENYISAAATEGEDAIISKNINEEQKTQIQVPPKGSNRSASELPIDTETKDLKGKTRGWVSVNPLFALEFPSVSNGKPFEKLTLIERWFGKKLIIDKEALGRSWADASEGSAWEHGDEGWEDVKRER